MSAEDLVWQEPPVVSKRHNVKWPNRVAALAARPGKWAVFGPYAISGIGTVVRIVKVTATNAGRDVEVTHRRREDDRSKCDLYVRVVQ